MKVPQYISHNINKARHAFRLNLYTKTYCISFLISIYPHAEVSINKTWTLKISASYYDRNFWHRLLHLVGNKHGGDSEYKTQIVVQSSFHNPTYNQIRIGFEQVLQPFGFSDAKLNYLLNKVMKLYIRKDV